MFPWGASPFAVFVIHAEFVVRFGSFRTVHSDWVQRNKCCHIPYAGMPFPEFLNLRTKALPKALVQGQWTADIIFYVLSVI